LEDPLAVVGPFMYLPIKEVDSSEDIFRLISSFRVKVASSLQVRVVTSSIAKEATFQVMVITSFLAAPFKEQFKSYQVIVYLVLRHILSPFVAFVYT
jgi:hypothetical protein